LEQQLDFSGRGAALTIAVPASQLMQLIERLTVAEGQNTALRMLPPMDWSKWSTSEGKGAAAPESVPPVMLWVTEGPQVRQSMERLSQLKDEAIVLVPVVIKTDGVRK
jgi:hypothetical protein